MAKMSNDEYLGDCELHTLEDLRWNGNHQPPITYWCRDIIQRMTWLMRQSVYIEHLIYPPLHCINSDMPPKCLFSEMHTVDWLRKTQVRRDTRRSSCANRHLNHAVVTRRSYRTESPSSTLCRTSHGIHKGIREKALFRLEECRKRVRMYDTTRLRGSTQLCQSTQSLRYRK
jgi:hypothetical protein